MSGNLVTFYMFYEAMTLLTVPLVLHNMDREAVAAAIKYLIYSVIGASAALIGIFFVGSVGSGGDFAAGALTAEQLAGREGLAMAVFMIMLTGFGVKAGMFPLHGWLPTAHPVAPAPASAVLSGVITKMGVLGAVRVVYCIAGTELLRGSWVQKALLALTMMTILMGSLMAFKEKKLKKRLAYSSVSQVSYVLFGIYTMTPLGFVGAMLHVIFHSLMKNTLFMGAGSIIHKTGKTMVSEMEGLGRRMPWTYAFFTVASLGLVGIPPTGGFVSKWNLAQGAMAMDSAVRWIGPTALLISAILTAAYLFTIVIRGCFPGEEYQPEPSCEAGWRMRVCDDPAQAAKSVYASGFFPTRASLGDIYAGTDKAENGAVPGTEVPHRMGFDLCDADIASAGGNHDMGERPGTCRAVPAVRPVSLCASPGRKGKGFPRYRRPALAAGHAVCRRVHET